MDNTLLDRQNSSYPTQPHSIIAKLNKLISLRLLTCNSGLHEIRISTKAQDYIRLRVFFLCQSEQTES